MRKLFLNVIFLFLQKKIIKLLLFVLIIMRLPPITTLVSKDYFV